MFFKSSLLSIPRRKLTSVFYMLPPTGIILMRAISGRDSEDFFSRSTMSYLSSAFASNEKRGDGMS